jgi:NAD(P)-dependent dehydrogenase (short-subunit alcohol dehydrogenase family)
LNGAMAPDDPPRHWFVTGAASGLGRRLTEHVLARGEWVTATARRPAALDDLVAAHGDRLAVVELDLARPADVERVAAQTLAAGRVDVLVNNAGYVVAGAAEEMSVRDVRDQVEVLLLAPILLTRACLGPMRERGGGRIVQISSMGGQVAVPTHSAYHAGKWGLEGYTESVAREMAEFGVHLSVVELGGTRTGFASAMRFTAETGPYRDSATGRVRRGLEALDDRALTGDPARIAAVIDDLTRMPDPPLRLTLGADAHAAVRAALVERLAALDGQRELAASVAFPGAPTP